jgi:predicted oxidoreductase
MKTLRIGKSDLVSTRLAYGCMRIAGGWDPAKVSADDRARGRRAVIAAWEAGYRLFDHADIYCRGVCESIFGEALREAPEMRQGALVATKCGVRFAGDPDPDSPQRYDFAAEHILRSAEASLKRLGIERIDLYQLHRPDYLMDPDEVAAAFEKLRTAGKVRWFGVSNFLPSKVAALASAMATPLVVNQVEIHLGRLDCFNDGTLDQCLAERMTPLAWSPLGRGLFADGGTVDPKHPRRATMEGLLKVLDATAARYGASRTAVSLAWLMKHPAGIIPIVGSANPDHIRAAAKADDLELSREDWYRLLVAARGEKLP